MSRPPWIVVAVLAAAHVVLSLVLADRAAQTPTYVFTPLVDVVPGGVPLSAGEASELQAEAKNKIDARDIQKAYSRMGSVLSLNDLLDGFELIDPTLTDGQRSRIRTILAEAQLNHRAVYAVQEEILTLEADLDRQVAQILAGLPPDTRTRVESGSRHR